MQQQTPQRDMNHRGRDIQSQLIVAHQSSPLHHPAEGALDNPAAWQRDEALLAGQTAHHLDHEIEERRPVEQRATVIGTIGKLVFDPRPALLEGVEYRHCAGRIGQLCGRQPYHQ